MIQTGIYSGGVETECHEILTLSLSDVSSAGLPNMRTPYLRLRLSITIRRVQRKEAKLAVNLGKLSEFLALAQEDIDRLAPLLSVPLPEKTHPMRKKIDYVALRAQYQQLLSDGTYATNAEVGRHLGVSRVWVSRVLKGIKGEAGCSLERDWVNSSPSLPDSCILPLCP